MLEAERFQGRVDDTHALVEIRMRDIRDVHEEIGVIQLLEGRAERGDERRWQLVDEADRVGKEDGHAAVQGRPARGWIERREGLIRHEHVCARDRI